MGIYYCAGLTAQLLIINPVQICKYNTTTVQRHKNKTLNRHNSKDMVGKIQYKRSTGTKTVSL